MMKSYFVAAEEIRGRKWRRSCSAEIQKYEMYYLEAGIKADKEVFARFSLSHLNETVGRVEFELR